MHTDIYQWKAVGVGSYWVTLSLQITLLIRLYQGLDFIGVFICNTDLLVEICFGWTQRFSAGLKKDISEICNCRARVHRLENLPWSYWSHIDHWGEYLLIYFEEGHDYGKFFFSQYSQASALYYSWRMSPLDLDFIQFQSLLFKLGGWPSCPFVAGRSCYDGRNRSNRSVRRRIFTVNHSHPCATKLLEAWRFSQSYYLLSCYNNVNDTYDNIGCW